VYLMKPADPVTFSEATEHVARMLSVARLPSPIARPGA
jgi:hypothetical protein